MQEYWCWTSILEPRTSIWSGSGRWGDRDRQMQEYIYIGCWGRQEDGDFSVGQGADEFAKRLTKSQDNECHLTFQLVL